MYALQDGGKCLDCGANKGNKYDLLKQAMGLERHLYHGIEWNTDLVEAARENGLNVTQGDLNKKIMFPNETFKCVFGLSVLEHLLNPCNYMLRERRNISHIDPKYKHLFYSCITFGRKNAIEWSASRLKQFVGTRRTLQSKP
jgi:2-polyprenyl-3-methyl-5-hydroxy-6-metoxy-1,4-benzoquinol methylase